jgi:glucosamine--fructose-6-phosphate aminotransferase (isomerizing)
MNPYISDILSQPSALKEALSRFQPSSLEPVVKRLKAGDFDRILISGMGSSHNAAYPALIELSRQPLPVQLVNAAELLHSFSEIIKPRTLLWLNSQSGRSAELLHLLERIKLAPPASLMAFVNDSSSPLAEGADLSVPIHAGPEATVSTKTYVNMLAINLLAAIHLGGGDVRPVISEMHSVSDAMESYLSGWESRVQELDLLLGDFDQLFLIGRGASMGAAWNGSLINKEAARSAFEGIHAAEFRHGPLELAGPGFAALILAGMGEGFRLNHDLAMEIISYGGKVIWLDPVKDPEIPTFLLPQAGGLARPLVEILPMQLLTLVMAGRKGLQAGHFRHIGKVTLRE